MPTDLTQACCHVYWQDVGLKLQISISTFLCVPRAVLICSRKAQVACGVAVCDVGHGLQVVDVLAPMPAIYLWQTHAAQLSELWAHSMMPDTDKSAAAIGCWLACHNAIIPISRNGHACSLEGAIQGWVQLLGAPGVDVLRSGGHVVLQQEAGLKMAAGCIACVFPNSCRQQQRMTPPALASSAIQVIPF